MSSLSPSARARRGLGRTFQAATLFPELTVRETVELALEARHRTGLLAAALCLPPSVRMERKRRAEADELIDFLGLGRYADAYISDLSTGTRRIVELAGLLALDARVLCLDEPTAGLAQRETEAFGPVIIDIRRELDASVLVIEHDMPLIMGISDRVYCLELGEVIAEGTPDEVRNDPPSSPLPRHRRTGHRPQRRGGPRRVTSSDYRAGASSSTSPHAAAVVRVEGDAGEREVRGAVATDAPGDARGAARAGDETHADLGQADRRVGIRDDVARERGDLDARAYAAPVQVRGHLARVVVQAAPDAALDAEEVRGTRVGRDPELREVAATAQRRTVASEMHVTDRRVDRDEIERIAQRIAHRGVERVVHLGSVQEDVEARIVSLEPDRIGAGRDAAAERCSRATSAGRSRRAAASSTPWTPR